MDKKLITVDDLTEVARDYNEKIDVKLLEIVGITRKLKELVNGGDDAVANLDTLENTLDEIKTKLTGAGVEVSTCQVIDLTGYIDQLTEKVTTLQAQINEAETQLEALI